MAGEAEVRDAIGGRLGEFAPAARRRGGAHVGRRQARRDSLWIWRRDGGKSKRKGGGGDERARSIAGAAKEGSREWRTRAGFSKQAMASGVDSKGPYFPPLQLKARSFHISF